MYHFPAAAKALQKVANTQTDESMHNVAQKKTDQGFLIRLKAVSKAAYAVANDMSTI